MNVFTTFYYNLQKKLFSKFHNNSVILFWDVMDQSVGLAEIVTWPERSPNLQHHKGSWFRDHESSATWLKHVKIYKMDRLSFLIHMLIGVLFLIIYGQFRYCSWKCFLCVIFYILIFSNNKSHQPLTKMGRVLYIIVMSAFFSYLLLQTSWLQYLSNVIIILDGSICKRSLAFALHPPDYTQSNRKVKIQQDDCFIAMSVFGLAHNPSLQHSTLCQSRNYEIMPLSFPLTKAFIFSFFLFLFLLSIYSNILKRIY